MFSQYADDTQLYLTLDGANPLSVTDDCFNAVHHWFTQNGLALNPDKSEAIVVGTGAIGVDKRVQSAQFHSAVPAFQCLTVSEVWALSDLGQYLLCLSTAT